MIKVTVTDGEIINEMEGKAVVAIILQPDACKDDRQPDAGSIMVGQGKPSELLKHAAISLGTLVTQIVQNPEDRIFISTCMMDEFTKSILGIGLEVDAQEKRIKKVRQEG